MARRSSGNGERLAAGSHALGPFPRGPRAPVLGTAEGKLAFAGHCPGPGGGDVMRGS